MHITGDYFEPLNSYTLIAMPPGERKSAVTDMFAKPINDYEATQAAAMKSKIDDAISLAATYKKRIEKQRREASKLIGNDFKNAQKEIRRLEKKIPRIPVCPVVYTNDVTSEKLAELLLEQGEKMAIISDEGGGFEVMAGLYTNGIPNIDIYLKGHSNSPHRVDRKSNKKPIHLKKPSLVMGLAVQPDVLRSIATKPGFSGRGLLARYLYMLPKSNIGYRKIVTEPLDRSAIDLYDRIVTTLLGIKPPKNSETNIREPYVLRFSKQAQSAYIAYAEEIETYFRRGGRFEQMKKWGNKFVGATIRLAGIYHVVKHFDNEPWEKTIDLDAFERAIRCMDIIADHTKAAFDLMGEDELIERARKIWNWIHRRGKLEFTALECQQSMKSRYKTWAVIKTGLDILVERNYLMDQDPMKRKGKKYSVNPHALA